jgi:hypothetical protein
VLGNERPAPPDELTEFQREVWQRTVASETSTLPASDDETERYHPTCHMLSAPPGGTHGPGGHLKVSADPTETAWAVVF